MPFLLRRPGPLEYSPARNTFGGVMAKPPTEMTAIEITEPGGPEVLRPVLRAVPEPGLGEVLIEVAAAGVNRPDTMQRQGAYPPPARRLRPSGAGGCRPRGGERPRCAPLRGGRCRLRADPRRRLCRILRRAGNTGASGPGGALGGGRRRPARDLLHSLDQCLRARPAPRWRAAAGPRWQQRHRHHCDPDRVRAWCSRLRDRWFAREMCRLRRPRRRAGDRLPQRGYLSAL